VGDIFDTSINTLQGEQGSLSPYKDKALLLVNVASRCGLTPQYAGLEKLQEQYGERGFSGIRATSSSARSRARRRRSPSSALRPTGSRFPCSRRST
jgi:glutathione peroxidase